MAIAFDSAANSGVQTVVSYSFNITIGAAGANRLIIVGVGINDAGPTAVSSITAGAVSLVFIRRDASAGNGGTELWAAANPPTGTVSVTVTLAAVPAGGSLAGAISLTGVDQTTPNDANNGASGATGTQPSVPVTTVADNAWLVGTVLDFNQEVITAGQTQDWNVQDAGNLATYGGEHFGPQTPPGAKAMTWAGFTAAWVSSAASFKPFLSAGQVFFSLPDDGEQFRAPDLTPRMLAMDDWLPRVPQPPLFEWDESQRWQLCRDMRLSQTTMEQDTGLRPIIPKIVYDDDPSRNFDFRDQQEDDPWHTFFLIPVAPPTLGWDDWDWSRDYSTPYAKQFETESVEFTRPIVPSFGWFDEPQPMYGQIGLSALLMLDEFVNAPTAPVFGPAPLGRSIRFGFFTPFFR